MCFSLSFFFFFSVCTLFIFTQVLGESLHITSEYLASEAKVESARSHASFVEAENSKLRKELIAAMDDANQAKEKLKTLTDKLRVERELTKEKDKQIAAARERAKGLAAKAVEGFQQTDKYNTVLFSWYFKGFFASEATRSLDLNPALKVVSCTLSSASSTSKVSRVKRFTYDHRISFSPCLIVSR